MKTKLLYTALAIYLFCGTALAGLESRINSVLSKYGQQKVEYGIYILHSDSGQVVYQKNARKPMIPASNMKIISSAAALHYLGPDYQFRTKVGLLDDTLVVLGGGDPLLGDVETDSRHGRQEGWIFEDIYKCLKEHSTSSINDIIIDSTFFEDERVHPDWPRDQLNKWYACEVSGLNFNNNCVRLLTTNQGGRVQVSVEPETGYIKIINQVKAISKGSSGVGAYRNSVPNKLLVRGKCRKQASFDVAIERPAAFFGYLLSEQLTQNGIQLSGSLQEAYVRNREDEIRFLCEYKTPIQDVLARCNKDSLGLAAESLVKTISAENTQGRMHGEWQHGHELIGRYLHGIGVPADEFVLRDGSGLSRENRLSPHALARVLHYVHQSPYAEIFEESLATGGIDGTIGKYFHKDPYKGKIIGKTGYIAGVKSFSGYVFTDEGTYVFSILTEGANGNTRRAINAIAENIFDQYDRP